MLLNAVDSADAAAYPGLLAELGFLSFRHAPYMQEMFSDEPDTLALASDVNGEIYTLPAFLGVEPACETVMFINQAWLDKLNLPMPETLNGLKKVLAAFRDSDCNGNGKTNDEIPLDCCGWFGSAYSLTNLIGAWGVQLTNGGADGFFAENGEVKNYAVDERYRALLLYLNGLYAEGLISKITAWGDEASFLERSHGDSRGNALVGVVMGKSAESQFGALKDQYVPLPPLSNQDDMLTTSETRWSYDYSGLNAVPGRAAVSAACASPKAAVRFLDAFYRQDISEKTLKSGLAYALPLYIRRADAKALNPGQDQDRAAYAETLANIDMMTEYYPQAFMNYTPREEAALDALLHDLNEVTNRWWPRFLTGKADVASAWEEYVSQVNAAGLPRLLAIRQQAYDTFVGK
ncbi:MAG: hypothetical protein IK099_01545 [Clostridia bacterium]|nr:hypothetical protein [Clostridia bacterium]